MLLQNALIRPALRTIKLGDNGPVIFDSDLINAILVAVKREKPPV